MMYGLLLSLKAKSCLLPVIDDVILDVDIANKTIRIHLMEGLLE